MKIGILFGSSSNEHEVSVVSASSIIQNLDKEKYEIIPIYLNKKNEFFIWQKDINKIKPEKIGVLPTKLKRINEPFIYLKTFDVIWIMIHGKNGEDGKLAHILDFLKIPYIGNNAESSIITMDKILTKELLEKNNIKTSPYIAITKYHNEYIVGKKELTKQDLYKLINQKLKYPLYIKPARSGSSIGITKVNNTKDLETGINKAFKIDNRILIEEEIKGRELECGIIEIEGEIIPSIIGEVNCQNNFYTFEEKYQKEEENTLIPANLDQKTSKKIQELATKIFKILNCNTYSRCDFFLKEEKIILNEINTIPGFTTISMYPKLFEKSGISYPKLLDLLIEESLK